MSHSNNNPLIDGDRRLQLLADYALEGLDPVDAAELAGLAPPDDPDALALELAAAAVELARIGVSDHPDLPPELAARIELQALRAPQPESSRSVPPSTPRLRPRFSSWAGWLVAAASIALVVYDRSNFQLPPATTTTPSRSPSPRDRFRSAPSARLVATAHPLARGASGTVVWDGDHQEGYLDLKGLAPVDPRSGCYQLWVFDADLDGRYPVDGGIFTISSTTGDEVVAVRPRITVRTPTLFAITLEPSGGVVVSDRERILLTAEWTPKSLGNSPRR